jgi:hypothetical protein
MYCLIHQKRIKMKKNIFLSLALTALLASCSQTPKTASIEGVYSMDQAVISDGTTETVNLAAEGNTQFKMYTPESYFFIYQGKDASIGFGVGAYTFADGKVVETNIFNTNTLDSTQVANLEIAQTEKGYTQSIPEFLMNGTKWSLKETYSTIAASGTSQLDGVWHQTKSINVTGQDSVVNTYNEYKIYQAGHFMWAARFLADTTSTTYSKAIGHGTFTLNNNDLTEDLTFTSNKSWAGKYSIPVTFNGTDEFTQTIVDTVNKVTSIKTYKRVSK